MRAVTLSAFTLLTLGARATGSTDRMSARDAPAATRSAGEVGIGPTMSFRTRADFVACAPGVYFDERGGDITVSIRGQRDQPVTSCRSRF